MLCLCLGLSACGKSEEATKADELILGIGEVSASSTDRILEAQEYYESLSDDQKQEVENYAILNAAIEQLPALLTEKSYCEALALYEQGDYESALAILLELGEYKDAQELATTCEKLLSPFHILMEYVKNESTYIASLKQNGIVFSYGEEQLTLINHDDTSLEIIYELGEPCIDWKPMDLDRFMNAEERLGKVAYYELGDYSFNHAKVNLTIPTAGLATCSVEYIEIDDYRLRTAVGSTRFSCSYYNFDAEFSIVDGFNTLQFGTRDRMLDERGNQLIATVLEELSYAIKDSGMKYTLKDLGWERVG